MQILRRFMRKMEPRPAPTAIGHRPQYGFFGDYKDFADAGRDSLPYDSEAIASATADLIGTYFRDEDCEIDGRYQQVHSALASVMDRLGKSRISVLDVGGGNGNNYAACTKLSPSSPYDWTILETKSMCDACSGRLPISWVTDMPAKLFDVVLVSGTLQVLPEPHKAVTEFVRKAPYLIVHRTPLSERNRDRLTVQLVDPEIYPDQRWPFWFMSKDGFRKTLKSVGTIVASWRNVQDDPAFVDLDTPTFMFGFLIRTNQG